jgi:zinc protease
MKNPFIKYMPVLLVLALFLPVKAWPIEATRKVLPNGLILLFSERQNLPIIKATLLVKASPLNEPPEKAGLASLTADLLMEGTTTRTSEEISEEIEFIGAGLDVSTDYDYTEVSLSVLKKDAEKGFEIMTDILLNPIFSEKEIQRKKTLIKGYLKQQEEEPGFIASKAFRKAVYGPHPYGRVIEGYPETIDGIKREDIVTFHRMFYRPNNAILAVTGDIKETELMSLLQKYLNNWRPFDIPAKKLPEPHLKEKPQTITIQKELTQANIILGHLGVRRSNPDYYALSVMNYILGGGGFASRLMTRIRDDLGLAYDVHSFFSSDLEPGIFKAGVQTKNESAKTVIDLIIKEMRKIQNEPVSEEELRDAKSYLTGSFPRRLDTMGKVARFLALTEFYGLGIDYDRKYMNYINSVTIRDVQRVAGKYLHPESPVLVVVGEIAKTGINNGKGK